MNSDVIRKNYKQITNKKYRNPERVTCLNGVSTNMRIVTASVRSSSEPL